VGVHAIQIEINRALYMDERRLVRRPYLATLRQHVTEIVAAVGTLDLATGRTP
jgi:N-formylglutamate amidohydrolase